MKVRKGFVSNSSSSSFICDITGEEYTSYDATLEDADMFMCEHSHTFCREFLVGILPEDADEYEVPELNCPICSFSRIMESVIVAYIQKNYNISHSDIFEFMKSKNKRLKKVRNSYYFEYLEQTTGKSKMKIEEEIKAKYSSYDEFCKNI